jgi:YidC/Oxa1 family membrane protein insertase
MGDIFNAIIVMPFVNVLLVIYNIVFHNFGIAIILFTILIRLITWPLQSQQIKGAKAMTDLQKDKRYIDMQAKYKGDKEKLAQAQMELYKEMKINPFASCLPTVIQLPVIIGLYQALIMALASTNLSLLNLTKHIYPNFLNLSLSDLIPLNSQFLWMNLSQPERWPIPGTSIEIPILTIIVVITTYAQQKLMTPPSMGSNDQSAQMTKTMNMYMPLLMGWISFTLAAGLAIYFVVSNLIGIFQYAMMGQIDLKNWRNLIPFMGSKEQIQVKKPASKAKK